MYNKNMVKRASKQDAPISKGINKIALGFTIIETMLFLAIAGLIFAGLVAGTNGAIRRQRYKDSVQGFVDDLRDLYSLVENTQVLKYDGTAKCAVGTDGTDGSEGRGRSNCSVYGIYAIISPNHGNKNNIEAYWVIGTDQSLVRGASSDIEFFKDYAQVGTKYMIDGDSALQHINVKSHSILWGADVAIPCNSGFAADIKDNLHMAVQGCDVVGSVLSNAQNQVELFIYRSPITGSINTLSSMKVDDTANASDVIELDKAFEDGENISNVLDNFDHYDVSLCVTGGSGMSYDGGIRMVVIDAYGSNTNAVRLIEADADENKCN